MPVSFLSAAQRERYGRYRGNPAADELARYFHLDDADRAAIGYRALTDRKAGFALARWLYAQCWTGTDRPSALFDRATS